MNRDSGFLSSQQAQAIVRLSALENLRDQARAANREALVRSIEKMIESELRVIATMRDRDSDEGPAVLQELGAGDAEGNEQQA